MSAPFLIQGTDEEGDVREVPCETLERARAVSANCTSGMHPWKGFAIWGNHPITGDWAVLEAPTALEIPARIPRWKHPKNRLAVVPSLWAWVWGKAVSEKTWAEAAVKDERWLAASCDLSGQAARKYSTLSTREIADYLYCYYHFRANAMQGSLVVDPVMRAEWLDHGGTLESPVRESKV